tara:strand:- start:426 stop:629 length:204 start_codon:yes stop_codon:yes gene_type:complete
MNIKKQWKIVDDIFREGDDCEGCMYRELQYYDLGQYTCELLDGCTGKPTDCPQFENALERLKELEEG